MPTLSQWLGVDKFSRLYQIIKSNGGPINSAFKLWRQDDLKLGKLVGVDKYGNRYYENPYYFYARNRWIEYADHVHHDYDASQVPSDWFGWLHYKTDLIPDHDASRPQYKWMSDHSENLTGRPQQYMPCTTTLPKIESWTPPKK